ncbi:unnamed protein product [Paramecium sonneborni]|uniref:Uncharacterized protein n=1 Tax=Paramecium sonneborni TaxID=65129 RepID=A0A8S1RUX6_9CILI|nr:unnamed protein product [Paramecium sonneborni]
MKPFHQTFKQNVKLQVISTKESYVFQYQIISFMIIQIINLYQKYNVNNQIKLFVNYSTYPQLLVPINDQSLKLKIGYIEDLKLNGIIWPENMHFIVEVQLIMIQVENLIATLYQCKEQIITYQLQYQKVIFQFKQIIGS